MDASLKRSSLPDHKAADHPKRSSSFSSNVLPMHRYKSEARWQARGVNDDVTSYNPWALRFKKSKKEDEENPTRRIQTNQSENVMASETAKSRRDRTAAGLHAPNHANTEPPSSSPNSPVSPTDVRDRGFETSTKDMAYEGQERNEKSQDSGTTESSGATGTTGTTGTSGYLDEKPETPTTDGSFVKDEASVITVRMRKRDLFKPSHWKPDKSEEPKKKKHGLFAKDNQEFTPWSQVRATVFNSWINVLLIFVPIGIAAKYAGLAPVAIFVLNFIAIIPLAAMLSFATEELALRVGETLGGLLNASFGNAVELIVSIIALVQNQVDIVQESLIGSMLSNLLLVLGMCFFFGGLNRPKQNFNITVANTASSILALAVGALIIPSAWETFAPVPTDGGDKKKQSNMVAFSRGVAILLLTVYGCYLLFQLKTHVDLYNEKSEKVEKRKKKPKKGSKKDGKKEAGDSRKSIIAIGGLAGAQGPGVADEVMTMAGEQAQNEEERETPTLSKLSGFLTLAISTALVGVCAESMVGSIDAITEGGAISRTFVGLILLPIVGNAAEHATAVTVACKDKMDLAIGVAIGSSIQIALLVIPLSVVLGWIIGNQNMDLSFDDFQVIVLFVTILLVSYLINDGESHWLEGVLLQTLYIIIALAAWFYPDAPGTEGSAS